MSVAKRTKEAIENFDKNKKILKEVNDLIEKNRSDEADRLIEEVLRTDSNNASALNSRAVILNNKGKYNEALDLLDSALKDDSLKNKEKALILNNKSVSLLNLGSLESALDCSQESLKLDSSRKETLNNQGIILIKQKKCAVAIETLEKALALDANFYEAQNNLGIAYRENKEYKKAIECYEKSLSLSKSKKDEKILLFNMGLAYRHNDENEKAIEFYNKALAIDNNYKEAMNNIGYAKLNDFIRKQAIKEYEKAGLDCEIAQNNIKILNGIKVF